MTFQILKSITGLKSANQQAEISIAKYNAEVRSGIYADTFAGLATMLEPDQAAYLYGLRLGTCAFAVVKLTRIVPVVQVRTSPRRL